MQKLSLSSFKKDRFFYGQKRVLAWLRARESYPYRAICQFGRLKRGTAASSPEGGQTPADNQVVGALYDTRVSWSAGNEVLVGESREKAGRREGEHLSLGGEKKTGGNGFPLIGGLKTSKILVRRTCALQLEAGKRKRSAESDPSIKLPRSWGVLRERGNEDFRQKKEQAGVQRERS